MVASAGGAMLLKSIDASGNIKDGDSVANIFMQATKEVGEPNVVQIITDNASNYKAAGLSIETKFPHIFWTPCVVHSLNLALKSICAPNEKSLHYSKFKWIADLVNDMNTIRNFILNHSMALAIFNNYSKLTLLKVAETRFASHLVMAKRLKEVKPSPKKMVMDANWRVWRRWKFDNRDKSSRGKTMYC